MTFTENRICTDLDDFSCVDDDRPENDSYDSGFYEDEEDTAPAPSESNDAAILRLMPCCVCLDVVSQVTMYPCGHLKVCTDCWAILVSEHETKLAKFIERDLEEEYRPKLKCPFCNTVVLNHLARTYA